MTDLPRDTDWTRTVRDPAEAASEGQRRIEAGGVRASYQIAPLPSGEWAVQIVCRLEGVGGMRIPWRVFPTREDCVASFVTQRRRFFQMQTQVKKQQPISREPLLGLLRTDLFGFVEPAPTEGS